jgi:pyridoxine/pyridoxamine 5'-phosphate oxidase
MQKVANPYMDDKIVIDELPRHGSPQDRGSADAYYQRPYDPHYYVGASMQSERVGKDDMTEDEILSYKYGYDNEEDRKEW